MVVGLLNHFDGLTNCWYFRRSDNATVAAIFAIVGAEPILLISAIGVEMVRVALINEHISTLLAFGH